MKENLKWRSIFFSMLCLLMSISFTACSDDDDDEPASPYASQIVGTWKLSEVSTNGSTYVDWMFETTTATFNSNGKYSGRGYFGNGSGTYKLSGSRLITYVDGESYLIYDILNLSGKTATFKISMDGSSSVIWAKAVKQ